MTFAHQLKTPMTLLEISIEVLHIQGEALGEVKRLKLFSTAYDNSMTVCRAYGNRMVLGGERLHEICETSNHLHCDYFLNSRLIQ